MGEMLLELVLGRGFERIYTQRPIQYIYSPSTIPVRAAASTISYFTDGSVFTKDGCMYVINPADTNQ